MESTSEKILNIRKEFEKKIKKIYVRKSVATNEETSLKEESKGRNR
jgi:hypothetical protein